MARLRLPFALFLTGVVAACGGGAASSAPRWVSLTSGWQPAPLVELAQRLEGSAHGRVFANAEHDGEPWLERALARDAWRAGALPGEWRAALPGGGAMELAVRSSFVLSDGEKPWPELKPRPGRSRAPQLGFRLDGAELELVLEPDAPAPEHALLRARLAHGLSEDGRWRAELPDLTCDGVLVFPGAPETIACEVPAASRLCFATVFPGNDAPGAGAIRVKLDGRTLFEARHPETRPLHPDWNQVALDVAGKHTFAFEVDGARPVLFAAPVLAPRAVGAPGARPWPETRPDLVLVICDTFRADNLAEWGGDPELAPNLNHLVEHSLRFLDARAAAAWTLPAIGTLMSGVYPGQHGGTDIDRGIVGAVETVAEVLAASGYRTAAVTDSGLFSHHYGQDQGFEWFEEVPVQQWNLGHTLELARARMACDDGRPLFLVVHTYRVHGPMRVGYAEDGSPWVEVRMKLREKRRAERARKKQKDDGGDDLDDDDPELRGVARRFYNDAVNDLDAKLGGWIDELEGQRFLERGVLVVTADHGNSYGEHEQTGHGGDLYDVKLRVPIVLAGRGIEARAVHGLVSSIDLAPTLAALGGTAPAHSWPGRSLLAGGPERLAYAFDLKQSFRQVAVFAEGKKLIADDAAALAAGAPMHAFDLAQDPGEEHDLVGAPWPGELGRTLAGALEPLLVPAAAARTLELPSDVQDGLRAIGYGH